MNKPRLTSLMLLSTTILTPGIAWAQDSAATSNSAVTTSPEAAESNTPPPAATPANVPDAAPGDTPDVALPGGAIIVTGRRGFNIERSSPQVVSVLSQQDIARTGEGDIAGALTHVTGLSVVGNGYVYVRGLGDRYSLALLNGSPLPSPEPLKRVVPLDLFPTSIVASSLVQKSYSVNFPGEFGGGVINLTTKAVPEHSFLSIGGGIGWDTETTNKLSYSYYGSKTDWTGYDNGLRRVPYDLRALFASNEALDATSEQAKDIGAILFTPRNSVVQKINHTQPNFSADLSAGTSFDLGGATLGVIAAAGYSNKTQTRQASQQTTQSNTAIYDQLIRDNTSVQTDNRIVANGLLGVGLEWGENSIRLTNVYIHDTDKNTVLTAGKHPQDNPNLDYMDQRTAFYERQLIDSQVVGKFKPDSATEIDVRAGYANSKRLAPYEITSEYVRLNDGTTTGDQFVNYLGGQNGAPTTITFSRLNENVWSAGADVSHEFSSTWSGTVGYAYQLNARSVTQREFDVYGSGTDVANFGVLRLDVLLQPGMWYLSDYDTGTDFSLELRDVTANVGRFDARLLNHAYYGKIDGQITDALSLDAGLRWEWAKESTTLTPVAGATSSANELKNEYLLPAATLTYQFTPEMQLRLNGSKTLARPQFRELIYQTFYDPESTRTYRGNPLLKDSQLYNAEGRFEWYFRGKQHVAVGAFYKHIKNPIESYLVYSNGAYTTYANAPAADLYGAELEAEKDFELDKWGGLFQNRRLVVIGNYTYTTSKLKVGENDTTEIYGASTTQHASTYFQDGAPMTGQSKHIANLQFSLESSDHLSQQTLLLNYASKRVTSRGFIGTVRQPDVYSYPGFTLDLVIRQGIKVAGSEFELKLEGRNLTGRSYKEYQQFDDGKVDFNSYNLGRVFTASASMNF